MNKFAQWISALFMVVGLATPSRAEKKLEPNVHKITPTLGVYAPDRFRTTLSASFRYEYNMQKSYSFGISAGAVNVSQEYFADAGMGAPEQGDPFSIFYYGRFMKYGLMGPFTRYSILGFGITRQHSESNLTAEVGLGVKFPWSEKNTLEFEINDYIFPSDHVDGFYINNNIEISLGVAFYL
jgi:hypothetical protein